MTSTEFIAHEVPGIADIFYLPEKTDPFDKSHFLYEIKTYKNLKTWDAHPHTILAIVYPTPQTLNSMIRNVESLRLVG